MSKFKQELLNAILELLWKQWTQLGIAGQINANHNFVLDPEALLIFSLKYMPQILFQKYSFAPHMFTIFIPSPLS